MTDRKMREGLQRGERRVVIPPKMSSEEESKEVERDGGEAVKEIVHSSITFPSVHFQGHCHL